MAYAAVVSVMLDLEQLLSTDSCIRILEKEKIEFLYKEFDFLESFLRNYKYRAGDFTKDLEKRIENVARKAEDLIDVHLYNVSLQEEPELNIENSLLLVIDEIRPIKTEIMKFCNETGLETESPYITKRPSLSDQDNLVGVEDDVEEILDRLTGYRSSLDVISVVGMGGIGKTSLVRRIVKHPMVVQRFDIPLWASVSQNYRAEEILASLVLSIIQPRSSNPTAEELGEQLYKCLKGHRYLVVLDDMWDVRAWDDLRMYFPDDANGSRIMLTTRINDVAVYASKSDSIPPYNIRFRAFDESWKIFCGRLFGDGICPPEIEKVGKKIVRQCQGLPLVVVVVAGLLSKMKMTVESWERIAESISSLVTDDPESCLEILALSYNHLPFYLKACFLYMAIIPQNREISVQKLIWLWMAEGCLKCTGEEKSLEEKGEQVLKELIDKNLVLVGKWGANQKALTCFLHDLIRDVCLREALKEDFLYVIECSDQISTVLDLNNVHIFYFDAPIMQLVRLRYLEINVEWCVSFPSSILNLRNLQTLVVRIKFGVPTLPSEIWMMLNLRHLCVDNECYLPDPPLAETDETGLQNLQALSTISPTCCTKEILSKISNLRKLTIQETILDTTSGDQFSLDHLANLSCLDELEKLVCVYKLLPNANLARRFLPTHDTFPQRLKELVLVGSYLQWEDMSILGMLPNLEWLELGKHAFWGPEWEQNEEGFPKLKFLLIDETNLEKWVANCITPFQVLEHLVLRNCKSLNEIPCEVGEIATLQVIELLFCSKSAANSAKVIQDEQESMGNDELHVVTHECMYVSDRKVLLPPIHNKCRFRKKSHIK
ncbi:hypothetical protein DH2020_046291 [Rehmannia glutinosa]|uniref:Uncharacterized protein n=1 Tax=Rehmannia glutinosa TaxID=99300 RepID=A0ABR0UBP8_REHGL